MCQINCESNKFLDFASLPNMDMFIMFQVVLKIIKHCEEEGGGGMELVQGVLLGLVVDNRLEITNCFPFPRHGEDEEFDGMSLQ